jgi:hypothetical protein
MKPQSDEPFHGRAVGANQAIKERSWRGLDESTQDNTIVMAKTVKAQ